MIVVWVGKENQWCDDIELNFKFVCVTEKQAHYQKWWIGHEMAINSLLSLLALSLLVVDASIVFVCTNKFYFWKITFLLESTRYCTTIIMIMIENDERIFEKRKSKKK